MKKPGKLILSIVKIVELNHVCEVNYTFLIQKESVDKGYTAKSKLTYTLAFHPARSSLFQHPGNTVVRKGIMNNDQVKVDE